MIPKRLARWPLPASPDHMQTSVQIVSAPWAYPSLVPIQLGALGAYLEHKFGGAIDLGLHPIFLEAMLEIAGSDFIHFHDYWSEAHREIISMLGFLTRYGEAYRPTAKETEDCLAEIEGEAQARRLRRGHIGAFSLSPVRLDALTDAVIGLTDRDILPRLPKAGVGVVGFSLNYSQVYMSGLIARRLKERHDGRLIFVFGGGSVSHPIVVDRLVSKIGVSGLVVLGEGEIKLEKITQACLDAPEDMEQETLLASLEDRNSGVFSLHDPVDQVDYNAGYFRQQLGNLGALPAPDFRIYFRAARRACEDNGVYEGLLDHLALSVEGSRGCFAKCDFCSLNRNWFGFRKKTGVQVAEETIAMRRKYPAGKVYFTDNVCDTWAEEYAETLIAGGRVIKSHMQLRAHHPPVFWAKLALSGVEVVQIGIEAVSGPLLARIAKGTMPIQNIRSLKLLAELGIDGTDASNIITHHPRSTLADVAETRRVLEAIMHFGTFSMVPFALVPGAPIYEELSREQKDSLKIRPRVRLSPELSSCLVDKELTMPKIWHNPELDQAWDDLVTWYFAEKSREGNENSLRFLESTSDRVWLQGYRSGRFVEILLQGVEAAIVDACHDGRSSEQLASALDMPPAALAPVLENLSEQGLLLRIGHHYLTVALRNRDAVLLQYLSDPKPEPGSAEHPESAKKSAPGLTPAPLPRLAESEKT